MVEEGFLDTNVILRPSLSYLFQSAIVNLQFSATCRLAVC